MTKRLMVLASLLGLALFTNLSFRVPTTVEAQAVCLTGNGPTFTLGVEKNVPLPGGGVLRDGDLFYLGTEVQFITQSAGARFFSIGDNTSAAFGTNPGFANTTSLGFAASTPNATATAISCNDSFWDISFNIAGTGATAGDVITLYFRQPNGTGRQDIVSFTVQADNASARVTSALAGIDLSALGHTPTSVGTVIPYEEAAGSAGRRTRLITVALPMNGTVADCNQLVVEVRRAGGTGTTTVALVNLLVTRNATSTATGTGLLTGRTGRYPTALRCPVACVACTTIVCDTTICFTPPAVWCNRLPFPTYSQKNFRVVVPGVNLNQPIPVFVNRRINPLISQYLGCGGYFRSDLTYRLIASYIAAQLDIQNQLSFWWAKLGRQPLGCHWMAPMAMPGMATPAPALPVRFSGGPVTSLTVTSSLQDLYDATDWVITRGTAADQLALLAVYSQLNVCGKD